MTAIIVGAMVIVTAAIFYPFWPDTAPLGKLWSSIVLAGMGGFSVLIGAWWKSQEPCRYDFADHQVSPNLSHNSTPLCKIDRSSMGIGTIAGGIATLLFGAVMYPFWPDTAVLGPFWSSMVMGGIGLSITIVGVCLAKGRG